MTPIATSKRKQIARASHESGLTDEQVSEVFNVSLPSVQKFKKLFPSDNVDMVVVKIKKDHIQETLNLLREFHIHYKLPAEKHELLEYYESKINN